MAKTASDLEKAGLRGPVRSVIEEQTIAAWTNAEGKVWPESTMWNKWEYDRDGRLTAFWGQNWSREGGLGATTWVRRSSYNAAGQLLRRTHEIDGNIQSEVVYAYDDKGRLASITDSKEPDNPIAFRYDANGRKTKIAIAKPIEMPEGTNAVSRSMDSLFEIESTSAGSSEGGSTITLYDEQDRPTELQAYDATGAIVSRTVRRYDEQGRVLEEKQTMDDPLNLIPAKDQKKMFEGDNASREELRSELSKFLGSSEMWSASYQYDAQGRKTQTVHKMFNHIDMRTETSYNEHGDVAKEISQHITTGTGSPESDGTRNGETVYSYEYDAHGNWTVKKTATRELPDGVLKDRGDTTTRTIEYY